MSKILVSYFSTSGVTKDVASKIVEMNNPSSRPEVKNKVSNLSDYDTVLIGFPVWWDLAPRIINTFIEENTLENKKIYVFATSGGSSVINSFNTLKNTYSNLNFVSAKRFASNVSNSDIIGWII